ncbi:MFS transporter [Arthrobacter sp. CG_A4]|uniref:MFS transporter n=1 Tax=Arthrobacter sp. CG_A4 TaxID=3071706 RepID=UPI002DFC6902|nr:MFS family permease [Arthrobacter sp. CG_A4]
MTKTKIIIRSARDVIEAVNSGAVKGGNERAIILIALGGIFIDAYDFTAIAFGLKDISATYNLTPLGEGIVAASIMFGAILGAVFGGYLVDRIGRYKMFMADMVLFVGAAIACALAWNAESLTFFRFLMGVGIGLDFPVALAFLAEYSARKGKGGRVTLWQPMWYIATAASFAVLIPLYFLVPESAHADLWRWAVGFGAIPAIVVLLVRRKYMDESASWAANQGDLAGAVRILKNAYNADAELAPEHELVYPPVQPKASLASYKKLFTPKYRGRTILAGIVGACQSMQYYAVGFYLPFIVGVFLSLDRLNTITMPLLFNVVFGVTGGFLGVKLVQKMGSWALSLIGFLMTFAALICLGFIGQPTSDSMGIFVGLLLGAFVFFHSAGPGAQGMTMATMSYPTSLRGTGAGFGQAILRVGSTISLLVFPILSKAFGTGVFWIVAIAPAVAIVALLAIRWDPTKVDVDAEDYEADDAATETASISSTTKGH